MRIAELLALLGRSWSRLFVYPGGLALLLILMLHTRSARGASKRAAGQAVAAPPTATERAPGLLASHSLAALAVDASLLILPWLGLALMPLPLAANIGQSIDVVMVLALLEWPRLLLAAREYRQGQIARLAAALNSYPPLIMALVLLALPSGSFALPLLFQAPAAATPVVSMIVHWAGAAGLISALPVLLGLGPFACAAPAARVLQIALLLRGLGIVVLATLPLTALVPENALWLLPLPVGAIALAVWGMQHLGRGRAALPWAKALLGLVAAELILAAVAGISGIILRG